MTDDKGLRNYDRMRIDKYSNFFLKKESQSEGL